MAPDSPFARQPDFVFELLDGRFLLSEAEQSCLAAVWQAHSVEKPQNYNGPLFTVLEENEGELSAAFARGSGRFKVLETEYAHYLATRQGLLPPRRACHSLAASVLPLTEDGCLIFGRMAAAKTDGGEIKFIGGAGERRDFAAGRYEPERTVRRELLEELGSPLGTAGELEAFAWMARANFASLTALLLWRLPRTAADVLALYARQQAGWRHNGGDIELEELLVLEATPADCARFVEAHEKRLAPYLYDLLTRQQTQLLAACQQD